jgi:ATP-binding cassette subfamily F protein uup
VSHDRAFLDNVVTQSIAFEGDGVLREYVGGYSDWARQRTAPEPKDAKAKSPAATTVPEPARRNLSSAAKLSFKETRELEALPGNIESLEVEQAEITAALADPGVYRDQPQRVETLRQRYTAIENQLLRSLARWEELEARQKA